MRTTIIFILLTISTFFANSQRNYCYCDTLSASPFKMQLRGELYHWDTYISGSLLFYDEYFKGDIRMVNGELIKDELIQYNGYFDELILFDKKSQKLIQLDDEFILEFHFNDSEKQMNQLFRKMIIKPDIFTDSAEVFIQVILEGKYSLFAYRRIKKSGMVIEKNREIEVAVDKYSPAPLYYVRMPAGNVESISKISRKVLISLFSDRKKEIQKLLRKNNIWSIKNESKLEKAILLLNSSDF